jgi:hypothetical protein
VIKGLGQSDTLSLEVWFTPRCKEIDSERSIVFMSVHESVDLACEMEANPANLSFNWHFEAEDSTGNFLAFSY